MSQKYERCPILLRFCQTPKTCVRHSFRKDCFRYRCFVLIDNRCIRTDLAKKRLCNLYCFKLISIYFNCLHQFIILCPMHQMSRLYH